MTSNVRFNENAAPAVDKTPSAPPLEVDGVDAAEVSGTIQSATERKFEWNTGRLFSSEEGHSQTRTWAVRVLSVMFVLPVVLTVLVDLGRGFGYLIGNKYESVGKIFTGKSWSFIGEASARVKTLADKVSAAYKTYTTPKTPTVEELNEQAEKTMKAQAGKLIDGYKALNGGFFHTNSSFSSPTALKAEKQIRAAQEDLVKSIDEYLDRNVIQASDFASEFAEIKEKVEGFINEAAQGEFYIANKVVRHGPHPLMSDVANKEFSAALSAAKGMTAQRFIAIAKEESDVPAALKAGVDDKIITLEEAKGVIKEQSPILFAQGLESGLNAATNAEIRFLNSAVDNKLVTDEEADKIQAARSISVDELAVAAAKDVAKTKTEKTQDNVLQAGITKAADQLIEDFKLSKTDRSNFVNKTKAHVDQAKAIAEAELLAQTKAQQEAELKAKQEAEVAEAERAAEVKKADDQISLLGKFKDFLKVIAKKQGEEETLFAQRNALNEELQKVNQRHQELMNTKVTVKKKDMSVFDAHKGYELELAKIAQSTNLTDAQRKAKIDELAQQDNYGEATIKLVQEFGTITPRIVEFTTKMAEVSTQIQTHHDELTHLVAVYNVFAKNNKGTLEEAHRSEVKAAESPVFETQKGLDKSNADLFKVGMLDRLRTPAKVVNVEPAGNMAEVNEILAANKPSATPVIQAPASQKTTVGQKLKNFAGAVAYPITGPASWMWRHMPSLRS